MGNSFNKREKRQQKLVVKLHKEGHVCVYTGETFPIQIYWCGNKGVCNKIVKTVSVC